MAFFHPFCDTGGGGERVLWTAVESVLQRMPEYKIAIYTWTMAGDPQEILEKVKVGANKPIGIPLELTSRLVAVQHIDHK